DRLLAADDPWIMQLYARGGLGKTMFLSWAIGRRCVPQRIPCARLDFDFSIAQQLVSEPWSMAQELAEQWDEQFENRPFQELRANLARNSGRDQALSRLGSILGQALPNGKPAVLLFDTLEMVLVPHPETMVDLLTLAEHLHDACPMLRVILSGRHNLTEQPFGE